MKNWSLDLLYTKYYLPKFPGGLRAVSLIPRSEITLVKLEVKNDATNGDNVDSLSVSLIGI